MKKFKAVRVVAMLGFLTMIAASDIAAAPWAEVGDSQLRDDIETLQAAGIIEGPVTSWPLPWEQIDAALDQADSQSLPPALAAAADRLRSRMIYANGPVTHGDLSLRATNEEALFKTYETGARGDEDASFRVQKDTGVFSVSLGGGWRNDPRGRKFNAERTYATASVGNWLLSAGFYDQWWGPSSQASLVLSNSAHPFGKIGFMRQGPAPFETAWLRWMGPWRLEGFVGVLDGKRTDVYTDPALAGFRFTFMPTKRMEIGISRIIQTCGKSRPCGIVNWGKALFPFARADNTGTLRDPGNQQVVYDAKFTWPPGYLNVSHYGQMLFEDGFKESYSWLAGTVVSGHDMKLGTWKIGAEYTDTIARRVFDTTNTGGQLRQYDSTYLHFIYLDGTSYRGRPLGHSLDGDARAVSLFGSLTDDQNRRWTAAIRRTDLNFKDGPRYRISKNREHIWVGEAGVKLPTKWGDVSVQARYQSDRPDTPGRKKSQAQAELGWTTYF
jgi:Capsule assembly protein Wzi